MADAKEEKQKIKEQEIHFVDTNKWHKLSELDLEQNYFAIDNSGFLEDYRLFHLQNIVVDITPTGAFYETYNEAEAVMQEIKQKVKEFSYNKENGIDSFLIDGREQLERIYEARRLERQKNVENLSYYVIGGTIWEKDSEKQSAMERFDTFYDALKVFCQYKAEGMDNTQTILGACIGEKEFDLLYVQENENYLVQDSMLFQTSRKNEQFLKDLQMIHDTIGFDKTWISREMNPEEVKNFVKEQFAYWLQCGGIEDKSFYMSWFDRLYEKGRLENLLPMGNQRQVREAIVVSEWENPYFTQEEPKQLAYAFGDYFVAIRSCLEGYEYSILESDYSLVNDGIYDNPNIPIKDALNVVLEGIMAPEDVLYPVAYDTLMERLVERFHKDISQESTKKQENMLEQTIVTLTVAECGEFHDFGEYHEGIQSIEEALALYKKIPPERRNGIPSIGIHIHTKETETYEDVQTDLFYGGVLDLEVLDYTPEVTSNKKAMKLIGELVEKFPNVEVRGSLKKYNFLTKAEEENRNLLPKRISIKEKLAEKKAVVKQRDKEKTIQETEKTPKREI